MGAEAKLVRDEALTLGLGVLEQESKAAAAPAAPAAPSAADEREALQGFKGKVGGQSQKSIDPHDLVRKGRRRGDVRCEAAKRE